MRLGFVVFGLAGLAGLIIGLQQFLLKFLYDQAAHTRTIWGLLFMLLGILGPALPLLLFLKRKAFARLAPGKRWAVILAIPVLYLSAIGLCILASTHTKTLIIHQMGLNIFVRVDPANPSRIASLELRGPSLKPYSFGYLSPDDGTNRFHFKARQSYVRFPETVTIKADGTSRVRDDGNVEIMLDFDAAEPFRLHAHGLANIRMERDRETVPNPTKFKPGKYRITITGRPK
jgi:hypothetical protein